MTKFIDVHVHPPVPEFFAGALRPYLERLEEYFGRSFSPMSVDEIAGHYRERDGQAVLLGWDAETATKRSPLTNQAIAAMVEAHPDVFHGFGSVDPHKGAAAVAGVHEAARLGLKGLKFHPPAQRFSPVDRIAYSIWEIAAELGLVVLVHTGFTGLGAGVDGGSGIDLAKGQPMVLDQVAADFPELKIILAHPSWPWQEEAIAVARHKANVYLELSGWSPKYLDPSLLEAMRGPLAERTLFGTDFPFLTPDKWLGDWEGLGMPEDLTHNILYENAARLLGD
ncbi:MAG: amidohydrolase family protein [Acidimicrobiia bacterium]